MKEGEVMTRPRLAKYVYPTFVYKETSNSNSTLERIANEGSNAFYYGKIGTSLSIHTCQTR